jgi:hypothetical protein
MIVLRLALIWIPFVYVVLKVLGRTRTTKDSAKVFVASAMFGISDKLFGHDLTTIFGSGLAFGTTGVLIYWRVLPTGTTLPAWYVTAPSNPAARLAAAMTAFSMLLGVAVSLAWAFDFTTLGIRLVASGALVTAAAASSFVWRRSLRHRH